jgi:hypothetical protein
VPTIVEIGEHRPEGGEPVGARSGSQPAVEVVGDDHRVGVTELGHEIDAVGVHQPNVFFTQSSTFSSMSSRSKPTLAAILS